jgi:hypothetical protein
MSNQRKLPGPLFEVFAGSCTRLVFWSTSYSGQNVIVVKEGVL